MSTEAGRRPSSFSLSTQFLVMVSPVVAIVLVAELEEDVLFERLERLIVTSDGVKKLLLTFSSSCVR